MRPLSIIPLLGLALLASACTTRGADPFGGTTTSSEGWREIAIGVGHVIGKTKADDKIAELTAYCTELKLVATAGGMLAPEKQRKAAEMAQAAVYAICSKPPKNVGEALASAVDAVEAVQAVKAAP